MFDPYDETEILRGRLFNYLAQLNRDLVQSKSNEQITNYINEIVSRLKEIFKAHNINDFKQLKQNLQTKNPNTVVENGGKVEIEDIII